MLSKFHPFSLKMKAVSILHFCYIFNLYRANIEAKLADIEEALDAISFDKSSRSSSRSTTPRSEMSTPVLGHGHSEPKSESGIKVQGRGDMNLGFEKQTSEFSRRHNDYHSQHNGYSVSRSYQDIRIAPVSRSNDYMSMARSHDYSSESSRSRPRSAGDGSARKLERDARDQVSYKMNSDLHLEIPTNGMSHNNLHHSPERLEMRHTRDKSRISRSSRDRSVSKEVTFSKDCKRSSPERLEYGRLHPNITSRKLSPRDHSTSNENSDQEYNSPRTFKLGHFNGVDLLPSRYVVPSLREQNSNKFEAVDPHPVERKSKRHHPEERVITSSPLNNSALYKAKSESELSMEQKNSSLGGSYKYLPLREALGKPNEAVVTDSPTKVSSVSQEDLRFSSMQAMSFDGKKAYSVDVGLQSLGLERHSPRKFNPSPEKLTPQRDAGESPIGTPRMHRKSYSLEREGFGDVEHARKNLGYGLSSDSWAEVLLRTKEPVKNLVQKFEPKSQ